MRVLIAVDEPHGSALAEGLEQDGIAVVAVVAASALAVAAEDAALGADAERIAQALAEADAVVLEATRATLTAAVVALCDRSAVRITPLSAGPSDDRIAAALGLEPALSLDVEAWQLADGSPLRRPPRRRPGRRTPSARHRARRW